MRLRIVPAALVLAGALALPAAAPAHVSVVPRSAPAGSNTVLDVRVPNERDGAATVKVDLKLPDGIVAASYEPVPGWRVRVISEQLARPIETDFGPIVEQISRVVWSGDGSAQGRIPPGAFEDFPLSLKLPADEGATLTFKALQTYEGGEIVRWIGAPDSEEPAAQLLLTAASGEGDGAGAGHGGESGEGGAAAAGTDDAAASSAGGDGDDGGTGLAIAGLAAGLAGLAAGVAALLLVRRRGSAA